MYTAYFYLLVLFALYNCSLLAGSISGFSSCVRDKILNTGIIDQVSSSSKLKLLDSHNAGPGMCKHRAHLCDRYICRLVASYGIVSPIMYSKKALTPSKHQR
jgi:hypothetical protein